jgi:hypothetical protein
MQVADHAGNLGVSDIWSIPEGGTETALNWQDATYKNDKR